MRVIKPIFPPTETSYLRYGKGRIYGDFARSALGVGFAAIGLFALQALWWVDMIFAVIGLLFLLYLRQVFSRTLRPLVISVEAISLGHRTIAWGDIEKLKLRHFGGHKYSTILGGGFFELSLIGSNTKITCDSGIGGFNNLLKMLRAAQEQYNIAIDDASVHNLLYLTKSE